MRVTAVVTDMTMVTNEFFCTLLVGKASLGWQRQSAGRVPLLHVFWVWAALCLSGRQ